MVRKLSEEDWIKFGFHDLPPPEERARMSTEDLAILLSQCEPKTPAHILVAHELDLRIAREQSGATWKAAGLGFLAALIAAVLGAWSNGVFQSQQGQSCVCGWNPRELRPQENLDVKPPTGITPQPVGKSVKAPTASAPAVQPAQAGQAESNPER